MNQQTTEKIREIRQEFKKYLNSNLQSAGPDGTIIIGLAALMENIGAGDPFADVVDFHRKFNINYEGTPRRLPLSLRAFRKLRIQEELTEYEEAFEHDDQEKQFDALIDIIYIALGTIHLQGWDFYEGWRRVHEANMAKVRATKERHNSRYGPSMVADDGKPADIIKPEGWTSPIFDDLVAQITEEELTNQERDAK